MPNKLTDTIKKALECYRGQKLFAFNGKKPEIYIHDIIDLINRQTIRLRKVEHQLDDALKMGEIINAENVSLKAENSNLSSDLTSLQNDLTSAKAELFDKTEQLKTAKAEVERLKNHIQEGIDLAKQIPEMLALTKAEAYKEAFGKLKEKKRTMLDYDEAGFSSKITVVSIEEIDNLLNELVGDASGKEK